MNRSMIGIEDLIAPLKKLAKVPQAKLGGVACFFVKNGSIVSSGINHNPTGEPMEEMIDEKLVTRPEVIHAEVAAIRAANENGVDLTDATLLITMSPCIKCAREIAETGIGEICYLYDWWDKAALDILREHGMKVKKLKEAR
ncbi:deaminase [Candidatus Saccharibacteria bacterium]|nr:deaminase [Candidatus Saccharibacteria bacterium]